MPLIGHPFCLPDLSSCHTLKYGDIQNCSGDTDGYFVAFYTVSHLHARLRGTGIAFMIPFLVGPDALQL
jgi:hypothetical protein